MFNCYEFTFDGESSAMYGLMVYDIGGRGQSDVTFGNKASIVETRTNNRIQPIYFGTNYHSKPLEFKLVFGVCFRGYFNIGLLFQIMPFILCDIG